MATRQILLFRRFRVSIKLVAISSALVVAVLVAVVIATQSSNHDKISESDKVSELITSGLVALQGNNVEAAREAFTEAIEIDPNSAVAHYDLGVLALQFDSNPQAAIDLFSTTLAIDPNFTSALYNRAIAYKSLARFEEAVVDMRAVVAAKPGDANAMKKLGELLVQTNNVDEGTALLEKAYELDPNLE